MVDDKIAKMSSVLGETGVVIGNVDGTGDLEIRGRVQGSVTLDGRVLIAETGVVLGSVEATHISVSGEVRGDLAAKDGVEVQAQGKVEGNIEAPRVGIEAGARVRGMLRTGGELPGTEPKAPPVSGEKQQKSRLRPKKSERRGGRHVDQHATKRHVREDLGSDSKTIAPDKPAAVASPSHVSGPSEPRGLQKQRHHKKGPPSPPTFVKGARGRAK